jgi:hypothetical protein
MRFMYPEELDEMDAELNQLDAAIDGEVELEDARFVLEQVTQPFDGDLSSIAHEDEEDDLYPTEFSLPDAYHVDSAVYEFVDAIREDMSVAENSMLQLFAALTADPERADSPWPYDAQPFEIDGENDHEMD